mgnify:CR=1 FL=1
MEQPWRARAHGGREARGRVAGRGRGLGGDALPPNGRAARHRGAGGGAARARQPPERQDAVVTDVAGFFKCGVFLRSFLRSFF